MKSKRNIVKSIINRTVEDMGKEFLKHVLRDSVKYLTEQATSCIKVEDGANGFQYVNRILYEMDPVKYDRHRVPSRMKTYYKLVQGTKYVIWLDCTNYLSIDMSMPTSNNDSILTITFKGTKHDDYRSKFYTKCVKYTDKTSVSITYLDTDKINCKTLPHTFDNLILKDDVRNDIIQKLLWWNNNKDWYKEHQLVHKIGVLLYGKPGTGKSTLIKAVASMFNNASIYVIGNENIINSIKQINMSRQSNSSTIIVVIEDIDILFKKRDTDEDDTAKSRKNRSPDSSLHALFQLLDGVYSTDNTIYIATTNFRDRLDEAVIRHGRFDIQHELTYFNYDDAVNFVKLFGYDESILSNMAIEYPVQPAYLQSLIMEHKVKEMK